MISSLRWTALTLALIATAACGKEDTQNNATGPCGGPDVRGCLCSDQTQGTETCDPDTGVYGSCMCTSMSVETGCCVGSEFYDCPSALTADACFNDGEAGACLRDADQDAMCQTGTSNGTNNAPTDEEDDPLCWANCRDGHELCAGSCGGGQTCWELCEEEHDVCADRCGGGDICRERCEASPTECATRCG